MDFELPLWTLSPAIMLFSLLYFIPKHMNYSWDEWVLGNSVVLAGIGLVYLSGSIKTKIKGYFTKNENYSN